ncbi:NKAP family protein [Sesbania bispinosa]|nr:NKAP family protein [Sesbania bispinosa]
MSGRLIYLVGCCFLVGFVLAMGALYRSSMMKGAAALCSFPSYLFVLDQFLGRDKDDGVRRSAVSGKKILLKLEKTKEDKEAESKRNELLNFLNASFD